MKKDKKLRAAVWILLLALVVTVPVWGGLTACAPNPTTVTLSTYLPTDPGNGCFSSDLTFSNFAIGQDFGQTINGVVIDGISPGGSVLTSVPTQPPATAINVGLANLSDGIELTATPPAGGCGSNSGSSGWCVQGGGQYLDQTISYNITPTGTLRAIGIDATVTSHSSGKGGGFAAFFEEVCVDPTNTDFVATGSCTGANAHYYVLQAGEVFGKFQTINFNFAVPVGSLTSADNIQIRDTVYLQATGATTSFADISFADFTDTPEPSTFALMGVALAGLGLVRYRRKA
jgi:hypothetical protein